MLTFGCWKTESRNNCNIIGITHPSKEGEYDREVLQVLPCVTYSHIYIYIYISIHLQIALFYPVIITLSLG